MREWDIFKIALLYTEQENVPYWKEEIHDLMQAFPLDQLDKVVMVWNVTLAFAWATQVSLLFFIAPTFRVP